MGLVRFVVAELDPDSGRKSGILQVLFRLRDRGELSPVDERAVSEIGRWLDDNLSKPTQFTRKRNDSHRRSRALSWIKDTAHEHVARLREAAAVLEKKGIFVETIVTDRPGYVVYEDEYQVVAEPFADTGA